MTDEAKPGGRAATYSPELARLGLIGRLLEGPATLTRITKEMEFEEAFLLSLKECGMELKSNLKFCEIMRTYSPGVDGKGIDGALKVLAPQPVMALPGAITEPTPGILARLWAFVAGRKGGEQQ